MAPLHGGFDQMCASGIIQHSSVLYRPTGLDFEAFFVSCEAIEREN